MTKTTKPATPKSLLAIIVRMAEAKPGREGVTAVAVETDAIRMGRLIERDLVKVVGKVESGKRGRPALRYGLTDKGRNRARRATA